MKLGLAAALGLAVLASGAWAAPRRAAGTTEIDGTYELVRRVMADGTVIAPPEMVALYDLHAGRLNFNLFLRARDGKLSSESTIARYTLDARQYCEWMIFTTRDNLDGPGFTHEVPPVKDHCSPVTRRAGRLDYAPAGESVTVSFGPEGYRATIAGQFVDYWRRVRSSRDR